MKIAISAESTIDLGKDLLERFDIHTVPFTVLLGQTTYQDGEISPEDIFKYVDEEGVLPKTSAVNEYQFEEHFKKLLENYDAIIHFSLSSDMSSAYSNALRAASNMKNVYVIDSRSLSTGIALQAIYARQLADSGVPIEEIVEKTIKRQPLVKASFVVNTTKYLFKGGRCSSLARFGSLLLRIKPQIIVEDGKMVPGKKYMGKTSDTIEEYVTDTLAENPNPDLSLVFITSSSTDLEIEASIKERLQKRGFKEILCTLANGTITSHCGPKTTGILFVNKD